MSDIKIPLGSVKGVNGSNNATSPGLAVTQAGAVGLSSIFARAAWCSAWHVCQRWQGLFVIGGQWCDNVYDGMVRLRRW